MTHSDKAALRGEPGYVWRSGQDRRLTWILRWADVSGAILDNGCGLGSYLDALASYSQLRIGLEIEHDRAVKALPRSSGVVQGVGESLPFESGVFDLVLSNEVIEHVNDDRQVMAEMARVTQIGGRIVVFCPNRWYPVETHGIYWRGKYKFGNIPLVNYLPNPLRNRLVPHVRAYSRGELFKLLDGLPLQLIYHSRVFGGYDNIEGKFPRLGRWLKRALYLAEKSPLRALGISHLLVLEKI